MDLTLPPPEQFHLRVGRISFVAWHNLSWRDLYPQVAISYETPVFLIPPDVWSLIIGQNNCIGFLMMGTSKIFIRLLFDLMEERQKIRIAEHTKQNPPITDHFYDFVALNGCFNSTCRMCRPTNYLALFLKPHIEQSILALELNFPIYATIDDIKKNPDKYGLKDYDPDNPWNLTTEWVEKIDHYINTKFRLLGPIQLKNIPPSCSLDLNVYKQLRRPLDDDENENYGLDNDTNSDNGDEDSNNSDEDSKNESDKDKK